jgi:hypothetical protein
MTMRRDTRNLDPDERQFLEQHSFELNALRPARNLVEPPVNGSCTLLSLTGRVGPLCRQAPCHTLAKQSACDAHR